MTLRRSLVGMLLYFLCLPSAEAAKVKVWQHHTQSHYDKAKFQEAVITSEGAVRLARQVKPLAGVEAANVWDLIEDRQGNLFAATGDEGKLYQISPSGKVQLVHASKESHLFCLAVGPEGTLYVGTGPTGKILRVTPDGKVRTLADQLDSYVWSLAYDAGSRTLYAGTGPHGKIYQVSAEGKSSVFYATRQDHVLCLALGDKGTLYAGTDKGGLIYRLTPEGKGFVLYHANQPEVRALLVTPGAVYAGTSAPVARKGSGLPGAKSDALPTTPAASGENSLYRIAPDGSVRELYRDKTLILRLGQKDHRLLAATGMQGQLFEIHETSKEKTEIARLDAGQIHALLLRQDGSLVLGSGDPGKLFVLDDRFAAQGNVLSEVLDTKLPSKWGTMSWKATTPPGTAVSVAVRSGNVAEPDETWSGWSGEQTNSVEARAQAPLARYLQYRVTLTSDRPRATPEFRQFALRYQTVNQSPELTSLEVPDLDAANLDNPKKLKIRWNATDPNEDELTYTLWMRKEGWKDWVLIEENFDKKEYEWDTSGIPSGLYQIRVAASDRKDNAPEDTLTVERISSTIPVTHLPPAVQLKLIRFDGEQALIEASATDPYVRLTEASFAVDGKRWANLFPVDGLFDSKSETFRFRTDPLSAGTHVVVLRVRNAAGNFGAGDLVLRKE